MALAVQSLTSSMMKIRWLALCIPIFTFGAMFCLAPEAAHPQITVRTSICRDDQLLPYYQSAGLSMGRDYATVIIRNRSARSCRLRGLPRIRQFDDRGTELAGGISGGCKEAASREPCGDLILNPGQRASFTLNMSDGGGIDNPTCATRVVLDSPPGTQNWPALTIHGFVSCTGIEPQFEMSADPNVHAHSSALGYHSTAGVEIDPYTRISDQFPRGSSLSGWSLSLSDAHFAHDHTSGPYRRGYDPPFTLILQNQNVSLILPVIAAWCDGGVTIVLDGPSGKTLPRSAPPCKAARSENIESLEALSLSSTHALALSLYLYDLGYDLSHAGKYKLRVRWQLPGCTTASATGESCSGGASSNSAPVTVESNEVMFSVSN
jgi:hypothetical protein